MKLTTSVVALAALMLSVPLLAQEESPAAVSEEETPATPTAESPAPTPSPTAETKASASTTTAVEQSTPPAKAEAAMDKTAPEKKASPAAAATAAPAGKKLSGPAALKDDENRWAAAIGKHDTAGVEALIAPDYIGVSPKGKVQNRRGVINEMKGDKDTYTSNKNEKLDMHMFGPNVGVVVGTYREKGTGKDGKPFDRTYRFTDTWVERGGNWQCVASQLALVTQK